MLSTMNNYSILPSVTALGHRVRATGFHRSLPERTGGDAVFHGNPRGSQTCACCVVLM